MAGSEVGDISGAAIAIPMPVAAASAASAWQGVK
jgi:hypothetical protein